MTVYRNPETWNFYLPIHSRGCRQHVGWMVRKRRRIYTRHCINPYTSGYARFWLLESRPDRRVPIYIYIAIYGWMVGGKERRNAGKIKMLFVIFARQPVCIDARG